MLRVLLLVIGAALVGFGLHLQVVPMIIWGVVILLAVVFERWRYQHNSGPVSGDWEETDERFVDPESGQLMQVLYQPATGERRYVPVKENAGR